MLHCGAAMLLRDEDVKWTVLLHSVIYNTVIVILCFFPAVQSFWNRLFDLIQPLDNTATGQFFQKLSQFRTRLMRICTILFDSVVDPEWIILDPDPALNFPSLDSTHVFLRIFGNYLSALSFHADPQPQHCFLMRIRPQNPYLAPRKRSLSSLAVRSVVLPWCCCVLAVHVEREDLMTPNSPRAAYLSMREPAGWNSNTLDNPNMPVSQ